MARKRKAPKARYVGGTTMSVRDQFPILRARLLASRPVLEPERTVKIHHVERSGYSWIETKVIPAKFGKPTFRNAIIDGQHV